MEKERSYVQKKILPLIEVGVILFVLLFALDRSKALPDKLNGAEYWGTLSGILIKYHQEAQKELKDSEEEKTRQLAMLQDTVALLIGKIESVEKQTEIRYGHIKEEIEGEIEKISSILDFIDIKELMPIILSLISLRDQSMQNIIYLPEDIAKKLNKEGNKQKVLVSLLKSRYATSDKTSGLEFEQIDITDFDDDDLPETIELTIEEDRSIKTREI